MIAVVGVAALAYFGYLNAHHLGTPVILKADTPVKQYSIQGTVNAVNATSIDLNASVVVTGDHGNVSQYVTKKVLLTAATTFTRLASASKGQSPLLKPATMTDLASGSSVVVFSSESPLIQDTFTATQIEILER